jgi:hypothetical protein
MSDVLSEPITAEVRMVEENRDWETIVTQALEARKEIDGGQWEIGDLADQVESNYGEDSIGRFAVDIGIPKETVRRWRSVSRAFPIEDRIDFLSHTHHRVVASREDRFELLNWALENSASVESLVEEMKLRDGEIDEVIARKSLSLKRNDLESLSRWYNTAVSSGYSPNELDLDLIERVERSLMKIKQGE